jgi:hypothetical protein
MVFDSSLSETKRSIFASPAARSRKRPPPLAGRSERRVVGYAAARNALPSASCCFPVSGGVDESAIASIVNTTGATIAAVKSMFRNMKRLLVSIPPWPLIHSPAAVLKISWEPAWRY